MSPTSVRSRKSMIRKTLALAIGLALAAPTFAQSNAKLRLDAAKAEKTEKSDKTAEERIDMSGVVVVSDREFNTFIFSEPVKTVMFNSGAPVNGAPVYLPGNTSVVIEFGKADRPFQMLVVMQDGTSKSMRVLPRPVKGVEYPVDGAHAHKSASSANGAVSASPTAPGMSQADARAADMELLKRVVVNDVPGDFEAVELPKPVLFDKFRVVPMRGWTNNANKKVMVFALVANAGQTAVVAPPQFYRPGITAVVVDGDVVDDKNSPLLYVVEETEDE